MAVKSLATSRRAAAPNIALSIRGLRIFSRLTQALRLWPLRKATGLRRETWQGAWILTWNEKEGDSALQALVFIAYHEAAQLVASLGDDDAQLLFAEIPFGCDLFEGIIV